MIIFFTFDMLVCVKFEFSTLMSHTVWKKGG